MASFEQVLMSGNWTPPGREIVVEVVGVGEQRFVDDGTEGQLKFP